MDAVGKFIRPIEQRIRMALGRAVVTLVDDARRAQEIQIELLADEAQDGVERFQNYGFTAHPHPGAEAIVACPQGLRSHAVAIVVEDRRYRLKGLQKGEVALYDDLGNKVLLARDAIRVTAVDRVEIVAPEAQVVADVVTIESDDIRLGGEGGQAVARVGDAVDPVSHVITSGSDKVSAA